MSASSLAGFPAVKRNYAILQGALLHDFLRAYGHLERQVSGERKSDGDRNDDC